MRRREFLGLVGGATTYPMAVSAQQRAMPVIGYPYAGSPEASRHLTAAFHQGLSELGYTEGRNVMVEYRWANNNVAQLPELAADLVHRRVALLVTPASTPAVLAAKAATSTIPVIFSIGQDPVELGLVASINRPGGHLTGFTSMNAEIAAKRLGLLQEWIPNANRLFVLSYSKSPVAEIFVKEILTAAAAVRREIEVIAVATNSEIDAAFASLTQKRATAVLVTPGQLFLHRRVQLVISASHHTLPAIFSAREFPEAGGLMSYGPSLPDEFRQIGQYAGRVLKGDKPADLPVARAAKFEFVINLQTAKTLGLAVPASLLARADEVIE